MAINAQSRGSRTVGGTIVAVLLAAGLGALVFVRGGGSDSAHTTLVGFDKALPIADALGTAKADNKPVLLFFTADWCPPCKRMKADVLPRSEIADVIRDQFVGVYVNVDDRPADARAYGVSGIPAFVILNSEGKEIARRVGGTSAESFSQFLTAR